MSIAEDIANMTAKFTEEKTKEVLSQMSLDEIAQVWSDAKEEHSVPSPTPEEKSKKDQEFDERRKVMQEIIPPEKLQSQINQYMEDLANGSFSPADFSKIYEFCNDFNEEFKNDSVKTALETMKQRMSEKRVELDNPVTLINDKLPTKLSIPELDSIVIEGDKEKISALEDKTQVTGKSVSFKGQDDKDLGTVSFDEKGNADITFANENNETLHYQLSADGKLTYLPEGAEPQIVTQEGTSASPESKKALKLAVSAQNIWKDYSKGELDNSVEKEIKVSEGEQPKKNDKKKTKISEANNATKVDEGQEAEDPLNATKFNEEESQKRVDGELDADTKKDFPKPEDELYWEEQDIIQAMFKEWFLKAANAATNWVVHQIEYCAAGIWNEFEAALAARKIQLDKEEKENNKLDNTTQFYHNLQKTDQTHTSAILDGYSGPKTDKDGNAKTDKDGNTKYDKTATKKQRELIDAIQNGNIDEAVAQNKLLQSLSEFGIDPKGILSRGNPETTVPFTMNMALMLNKFTSDYAITSAMNAQMNNPEIYKGVSPEAVYGEKQQEARRALMRSIIAYRNEHPNESLDKLMFSAITASLNDIKEAKKITENDLDKKNKKYVEQGKNPTRNEILERYENLAKIPEHLPEQERQDTPETHQSREDTPETDQSRQDTPETDQSRQDTPETRQSGQETEKTPLSLADEAERQFKADEMMNFIRDGLNMENMNLDAREQNVQLRLQRLEAAKRIFGGNADRSHVPNSPLLLDEQEKLREQNKQSEIKIPFRRPVNEI